MNTRLLFLISIFALLLGACASPQQAAFSPAKSGYADEAIYAEISCI